MGPASRASALGDPAGRPFLSTPGGRSCNAGGLPPVGSNSTSRLKFQTEVEARGGRAFGRSPHSASIPRPLGVRICLPGLMSCRELSFTRSAAHSERSANPTPPPLHTARPPEPPPHHNHHLTLHPTSHPARPRQWGERRGKQAPSRDSASSTIARSPARRHTVASSWPRSRRWGWRPSPRGPGSSPRASRCSP